MTAMLDLRTLSPELSKVAQVTRAAVKARNAVIEAVRAAVTAGDVDGADHARLIFKLAHVAQLLDLPAGQKGLIQADLIRLDQNRTDEQRKALAAADTAWNRVVDAGLRDLPAFAKNPGKSSGGKNKRLPGGQVAGRLSPSQERIQELETQLEERAEELKAARGQAPKITSPGQVTDAFVNAISMLLTTQQKNPGKFLGIHRACLEEWQASLAKLQAAEAQRK